MNDTLRQKLENHQLWLNDPLTGAQCDHRNDDLTGTDFRAYNISRAILPWNNLTDCKMSVNCQQTRFVGCTGNPDFSQSDISNSTFEKAGVATFNFIGAIWNSKVITKISTGELIGRNFMWCTNAFVQLGCAQRTLSEWQTIAQSLQTITDFYIDNPQVEPLATWNWWNANKQTIFNWYAT